MDIAYFRGLIANGGPHAIIDRLYVAPPAIFPSLMAGIASGSPEWLTLYMDLRVETEKTGASGTTEQLDDALARALAKNAEGVLRLAASHAEIPIGEICSRVAPFDGDSAEVLDQGELLGIVRRQRAVEKLKDKRSDVVGQCLAAARALTHRQLRIYFDSYGASDAAREPSTTVSPAERDELETFLTTARRDPALRPRLDGRTPDGPFRIAQIPPGVLACCAYEDHRIANPEGPWEFSDMLQENSPPRARLLNACKVSNEIWDITFEKGGFTTQHGRIRARLTDHGWEFTKLPPGRRQLSPATSVNDYWLDCHDLGGARRAPR